MTNTYDELIKDSNEQESMSKIKQNVESIDTRNSHIDKSAASSSRDDYPKVNESYKQSESGSPEKRQQFCDTV